MDNLRSFLPLTRRPSSCLSSTTSDSENYLDMREKAEQRLDLYKRTKDDDTATLLAITMNSLPKQGGQNLMSDIIEQKDDILLKQLRNHFVDAILKPMKALGGKTPAITRSPSHDSIATVQLQMSQIEPSGRDGQRWLKEVCLRRDDDCCVITGTVDFKNSSRYRDKYPSRNILHVASECAHILPLAIAKFDRSDYLQVEGTSIIWGALFRYFPGLEGLISPDRMNIPENAMTLCNLAHTSFGLFEIGLQQTDDLNTYRVDFFTPTKPAWSIFCSKPTITFNAAQSSVSLPDPILLQAHYAIAKILQVSGVGDKIDTLIYESSFDWNIEPDGSSDIASMISRRLLMQV